MVKYETHHTVIIFVNPKVSFIIFLLYAKGSRAWSGELCSTSVFRFSATEDLPAARCPSSNVLLLKAPQWETAQPLFHVQMFSEHWSHCSIFFMVVHCSMFVVRCLSCIGSKMRDSGPIVQKPQNPPRIDAFFPTITLLLTRSMQNMTIWRCTKRINERWNMSQIINLKKCVGWPTKNMLGGRHLCNQCSFPIYYALLLLRILIGPRPPSRFALEGNRSALRSMASRIQTFMQKIALGLLLIISTGHMCMEQLCLKGFPLWVPTEMTLEGGRNKDNSRAGRGIVDDPVFWFISTRWQHPEQNRWYPQ